MTALIWSGESSRIVAIALRQFLVAVEPAWQAWLSELDIGPGHQWRPELEKTLRSARFGIICVAPATLSSQWVLFEAGMLLGKLKRAAVCPYLIGVEKKSIVGPLSALQVREATLEGTMDLLLALANTFPDSSITERVLERRFERNWPALRRAIDEARMASRDEPLSYGADKLSYQGLRDLIEVHFAASAGRLTHVFNSLATENTNGLPLLDIEEFCREASTRIRKGRELLRHFHADGIGNVADYLEKCMPLQKLLEAFRTGWIEVSKQTTLSAARRAAFNLLEVDQRDLMEQITDDLRKKIR